MATPYRPSCGTEGADFMEKWCACCARDRAFRNGEGDSCPIASATMTYRINEPGYPPEWVKGENGPRCTAFEDDDPATPKLDPRAAVRDLFQQAA